MEITERVQLQGGANDQLIWSFRLNGRNLSEMQPAPVLTGHFDQPTDTNSRCLSGEFWAARVKDGPSRHWRLANLWNWPNYKLKIKQWPVWYPGQEHEWHLISPETGAALHRPIVFGDEKFCSSPDGQWLAVGGNRLRVWHVPPRSPVTVAILAALAPWLTRIRRLVFRDPVNR